MSRLATMSGLLGVGAILVLLGAAQVAEPRFQGFPLADGDWVVLDTESGMSCQYLARGLTEQDRATITMLTEVSMSNEEANGSSVAEAGVNATNFAHDNARRDCRYQPGARGYITLRND